MQLSANVEFVQCTKEKYLTSQQKDNVLYFCTDTYEIYKGKDSYSSSVRYADDYEKLPASADGKIYITRVDWSAYAFNQEQNKWQSISCAIDNDTLEYNDKGQIKVSDKLINDIKSAAVLQWKDFGA